MPLSFVQSQEFLETEIFHHSLFKCHENENNLFNWYKNPAGLILERNFPFIEIKNEINFQKGDFHRTYEASQILSNKTEIVQKYIFSPQKFIFYGKVIYAKNYHNQVKQAVNLQPYQTFFKILDRQTANFTKDQIDVHLNWVRKLFQNFVIHSGIEYSFDYGIRDRFIQTETKMSCFDLSLGISYLTPKTQISLFSSIFDGISDLEAPSELKNPTVKIRYGQDIFVSYTSSTYQLRRNDNGYLSSFQVIRDLGNHFYAGSSTELFLSESCFSHPGFSGNHSWGFFQEDTFLQNLSLRYLNDSLAWNFAFSFDYFYSNQWTKADQYNFLYQNMDLKIAHLTFFASYQWIPVISRLLLQIGLKKFEIEYDDYLAHDQNTCDDYAFHAGTGMDYRVDEMTRSFVNVHIQQSSFLTELVPYQGSEIEFHWGVNRMFPTMMVELVANYCDHFSEGQSLHRIGLILNFRFE